MKITPRIFSQGALDGACFLYSIANAMRTLYPNDYSGYWTKPRIDRWNLAIKEIPFALDYLLFDVGTARIDIDREDKEDPILYLKTLDTILDGTSGKRTDSKARLEAKHISAHEFDKPRDLSNFIDPQTVLLLCVSRTDNQPNLDHWVCATGKPGSNKFEIACSWILLNSQRSKTYNYIEKTGYQNRLYNDWIKKIDDRKVICGPVFQISRI